MRMTVNLCLEWCKLRYLYLIYVCLFILIKHMRIYVPIQFTQNAYIWHETCTCVSVYMVTLSICPQESPRNTAAHHCGVHGWCYARDISVHWPPRQRRKLQGTSGICWRGHLLGKKSPLLDVFPASTSNSCHKISSLFAPTTKTMEKTCLEAETTNWIIKWCLKL